MRRMRWLVGDVQGCARELDDLLRFVGFDPARDELWCVGDLVNRGPESLETLRLWRDVDGHGVIGNHDIYALLAASGARSRKRADDLQPLFDADDRDALLGRLRALPALVRLAGPGVADDVWCVHAGLDPRWTDLDATAAELESAAHDDDWLQSDDVSFATRVRCCTADGESCRFSGRPEECPPPHRPWDELYRGPLRVVHGHWAMRGHYRTPLVIGLDSGCCYGGSRTAWCHEEDRVVQVPSRLQGRGPVTVG